MALVTSRLFTTSLSLMTALIFATLAGVDALATGKSSACSSISARDIAKADALFAKGHKAVNKKNGQAAEQYYRKAIELNPSEARYHRQLAFLLTSMSRAQEAEREARWATATDPQDWRSRIVLGNIYHCQGRIDEEVALYKQTLELLPEEQKDVAKALKSFINKQQIADNQAKEKEKHKRELEEAQFKDQY